LLTPLGAAGIVGAMGIAIFKSHWKNGFWAQKHGYEYALALFGMAVTLGLTGPGNYAFDALLGITGLNVPLFVALAIAALVVDGIGILISRPAAVPAEGAPKAA
jgi:putative oxidoreductase